MIFVSPILWFFVISMLMRFLGPFAWVLMLGYVLYTVFRSRKVSQQPKPKPRRPDNPDVIDADFVIKDEE